MLNGTVTASMTVLDSPLFLGIGRVYQRVRKGGIMNGRLSITEVAKELGVTTKTITRWEKAGKIRQASRDWRGWRVYTPEDLDLMKGFVEAVY